jgi:hypothetical protein
MKNDFWKLAVFSENRSTREPRLLSGASLSKFYVVRTVNFGMKLYSDQRNVQVLNLFINFTSALHVSGFLLAQLRRGSSLLARALTPYPGD